MRTGPGSCKLDEPLQHPGALSESLHRQIRVAPRHRHPPRRPPGRPRRGDDRRVPARGRGRPAGRLPRALVLRPPRRLRAEPRLLAGQPLALGLAPHRLRDHPPVDARHPGRGAHDRARQGRGPATRLGGRGGDHGHRPPREPGSRAAGGGDAAVRRAPRRLRDRLLRGHAPARAVPQPRHPPGRRTGHAGGDLDEQRARLRRVHVLPEQLPGDARPRPDDPVRLEGPGRADRLPRVLRPRGGHDPRPRHPHPRAAPRAPAGRGGDASRPARRGARRGAAGPAPAVRRRRRGAAPPPGAARRPGHAPRHPRARGGLERHREAQRVGSGPDGHGSRPGSSTPGPGSSSRSCP